LKCIFTGNKNEKMFIEDNTVNPEILIKLETTEDYNEKEVLAQASQIECTWEEVKG
jgi:hypothetical protein